MGSPESLLPTVHWCDFPRNFMFHQLCVSCKGVKPLSVRLFRHSLVSNSFYVVTSLLPSIFPTSYFVNKKPFVTLELFSFEFQFQSIFGVSISSSVTNTNHPQSAFHHFCSDSCSVAVALPLRGFKKLTSTMTLIDIRVPSSSISNLLINHMPPIHYRYSLNHLCE